MVWILLIEHQNGLIVDFVALINNCHECQTGPKPVDVGYDAWQAQHAEQCQKIIDRAVTMGHGDRKGFNSLVENCGIGTGLRMGTPRHLLLSRERIRLKGVQ